MDTGTVRKFRIMFTKRGEPYQGDFLHVTDAAEWMYSVEKDPNFEFISIETIFVEEEIDEEFDEDYDEDDEDEDLIATEKHLQ